MPLSNFIKKKRVKILSNFSRSKKFGNKYPCGNFSMKPNEGKDTGGYILGCLVFCALSLVFPFVQALCPHPQHPIQNASTCSLSKTTRPTRSPPNTISLMKKFASKRLTKTWMSGSFEKSLKTHYMFLRQ